MNTKIARTEALLDLLQELAVSMMGKEITTTSAYNALALIGCKSADDFLAELEKRAQEMCE